MIEGIHFLYFFIFLFTITFIGLSIYFFSIIKQKWNVFLLVLSKKYKQYKKLLYLCYKHQWEINDWIFNSFVYFYKHEYKAIEDGFEIEKDGFPRGKAEIVDIYRYITKYRKDNIKDFKDMIIKDRVEIFGSFFISYNFKVDEQRRIHVHPSNNGNVVLAQMKHSNILYELDNEVSKWILEKRRFFNI